MINVIHARWALFVALSALPLGCGSSDNQTADAGADAPATCNPACTAPQVCNPSNAHCVACLDDTSCASATASACNVTTNSCEACTTNAQCTHLTGTPACSMGTCVQCGANSDCDSTHACDPATHTCVAITPAAKYACDSCLRDSECQTGQACVHTTRFSQPVPGTFCAWVVDTVNTGTDCTGVRPFVNPTAVTTADGTPVMVCQLVSSSCPAFRSFLNFCPTPSTTMSSPACSPNMDGFCVPLSSTNQECTIGCSNNIDCPCTDGSCVQQFKCMGIGGGFCSPNMTCTWNASTKTCN